MGPRNLHIHVLAQLSTEDQAEIACFLIPCADDLLCLVRPRGNRSPGLHGTGDGRPCRGHLVEAFHSRARMTEKANHLVQDDALLLVLDIAVPELERRLGQQVHP